MTKKRREIPYFDLPMIETHFHLDMLKSISREDVLSLCKKHYIEKMITISVSPSNLDEVINIASTHENIYCTQGLHPHEGKEWSIEVKSKLISNLKDHKEKKIVAIGEIGLDYYYSKSPREEQKIAFEEQLQIAIDHNLPVVIHTRDADDDTISILKNFPEIRKRGAVLHSFTSSLRLAEFVLGLDFYLGFNGIITFKNAENVRDALKITPINRVLLETDAPFLTPEPYRGHENAPYYLPFIAEKIAEVKNTSLKDILETCYKNTNDLFYF